MTISKHRRWVRSLGVVLMLTASLLASHPATADQCDHPLPGFDDKCEQWIAGYDNLNGHGGYETDYLNAIGTTPDGDLVFVTGTSWDDGTNSFDIATLALDSEGELVWLTRYSSAHDSTASPDSEDVSQLSGLSSNRTPPSAVSYFRDDEAFALAVSPDGKTIYVTGFAGYTSSNVGDLVTIAYDAASGRELWVRTYDGPGRGFDMGYDVVVSPDGSRVFVTGSSAEPSDSPYETKFNIVSSDFITIGYDATNEEEPWVSRYDGFEAPDVAYAIGVSPDGEQVFVTGPSTSAGVDTSNDAFDFTTVSYDPESGERIWTKRTDHGLHDYPYDLNVSPDGSKVLVAGGGAEAYRTEAYRSSDGKLLWSVPYHGEHEGFATANAMALDPAGSRVYVTGSIPRERGYDYGTVAYDASTGQQLWTARYSWILSPSIAHAVVATTDHVVVTGYSSSFLLGEADATTVTYDSVTGQQLWAARYNTSGDVRDRNYGQALVVNPDASEVYVGGMFMTSGANTNYGLLAYSL